MKKEQSLKELQKIPGVGKSIANDLWNIGIQCIADLKNKNPESLYVLSNEKVGITQYRCLLYVFRCAIYYANTETYNRVPEKLKWWNWKDKQNV